jgi:hypothetical protein
VKRWKGSRLGLAAAVALEKQRFWQLRPFMKLRAGDDATYMRERDRALQNRRTRAMLAIHLHRALQIPVKEAAAWVVKSERERASVLRMITHVRYPTKARK